MAGHATRDQGADGRHPRRRTARHLRGQRDPRVRPLSLGEQLRAAAATDPDAVAFVEGDRRLTYAEWDWLSDRAAFSLWAEGVRPGDVVALLLAPSIVYPVAYLGAAKIGAVTTGINHRFSRPEKEHVLDDARATALITDDPDAPAPRVLLHPERLTRPGAAPPPTRVGGDDPVAVVYTSGTTGLPRGAVFTARALDAVRRIEASLEQEARPRGIQGTPMSHVGFMTKIGAFIQRRATTVLVPRWDAGEALATIARERLTAIGGVPTQLALMLEHPSFATTELSSVRRVTIGGAPASPGLVRRIRGGFGAPVSVRYSCTELALATGTRADDPDEVVAATVGRPLPEVDLRIDEPGADGVGDILVRSPAMFAGYHHGPVAGSYHRTGDLGRLREDGNLVLAGRAKDMYIRGGFNVYPLEVEHVLEQHPAVARAAIVGVPDDTYGERGCAFVVARAPVTAETLRAFLREQLAGFKLPDDIVFREVLPMTSMMKVDKRALLDEVP